MELKIKQEDDKIYLVVDSIYIDVIPPLKKIYNYMGMLFLPLMDEAVHGQIKLRPWQKIRKTLYV